MKIWCKNTLGRKKHGKMSMEFIYGLGTTANVWTALFVPIIAYTQKLRPLDIVTEYWAI